MLSSISIILFVVFRVSIFINEFGEHDQIRPNRKRQTGPAAENTNTGKSHMLYAKKIIYFLLLEAFFVYTRFKKSLSGSYKKWLKLLGHII